jgi:hypothetical protein
MTLHMKSGPSRRIERTARGCCDAALPGPAGGDFPVVDGNIRISGSILSGSINVNDIQQNRYENMQPIPAPEPYTLLLTIRISRVPGRENNTSPRPFRVPFWIAFLVLLVITGPVSAATVWPITNTTGALGNAISHAAPGDIIVLAPGTYFENEITISKNITITANTSIGGSWSNTIIDGHEGYIISVNTRGVSVALDNLTFRNGNAGTGGAIFNTGGSTINITSSNFTNCSAFGGGAIANDNGSKINIITSTFTDCQATGDSGGAILNAGTLSITSSSFTNCSAQNGGGAIYNYGVSFIYYIGTLSITSSTFTNCQASSNGGAIWNGGTITSITTTAFNNDQAPAGYGGAIYNAKSGTIQQMSSSTITNCSAAVGGGAITNLGTLHITASTVTNCSADTGGAIANVGTLNMTSSTITNCSAVAGGAFFNGKTGRSDILDSAFNGCSATDHGGAIFNNNRSVLSIASSSFTNCQVSGIFVKGGAIYNAELATITNITSSSFTSCQASGIFAAGGAIYNAKSGTITTITSPTFTNCQASGIFADGAAIYNAKSGTITTITSPTFTNCQTSGILQSGGPVYNTGMS